MKKYVAIGDIHGCGKTLQKLLEKLKPYEDRTMVFMGDYIDRGPNSKLAIDLAIEMGQKQECIYLRGNHEVMMIDAFKNNYAGHWTRNGGLQTMISLGIKNIQAEMPEPYNDFIYNSVYYYDTPDFFFIHGGIPPMITIEDFIHSNEIESGLWERSHLHASKVNWEKPVVFGHSPLEEPILDEMIIGTDTGCVFHNMPKLGKLSAVLLPERKIIQQPYSEY